jgi:hypothetical protein
MITNIQERVERSIFEAIRLTLVENGYLKNIKDYTQDGSGSITFDLANKNIIATKGFFILVFGQSSAQSRGEKTVPRIVVQTQGSLPGDIGSPITSKEVTGETYAVYKHPYSTSNFKIDIIITHNKASHFRVCAAIVAEALGTRNYIPFYDDPTSRFFIEVQNSGYSIRDIVEGLTDSVLSYQVKDLYEVETKTVKEDGPLITDIKVAITEKKSNKNIGNIEVN